MVYHRQLRGLGRSLTEAVLANGDQVAATARKPGQLKDLVEKYNSQIYPIELDVTDYGQVKKAVADTIARFGRIDVHTWYWAAKRPAVNFFETEAGKMFKIS